MFLPSKLLAYYWASKNLDPSQAFNIRVASKQTFGNEPFLAIDFLLKVSSHVVRVIPSIAIPTFGESLRGSSSKSSKSVSFSDSVLEKRFSGEDSVTSEGLTSEAPLKPVLTPRDNNQRLPRQHWRQYNSECQWNRNSWRKRTPARQVQSERRYRAPQKQQHKWRQPEPDLEGNSIAEMLHQIHQPKKYRYRNSTGFHSKSHSSKRKNSRQRSRRGHRVPRNGPSAMLQRMIAQDC